MFYLIHRKVSLLSCQLNSGWGYFEKGMHCICALMFSLIQYSINIHVVCCVCVYRLPLVKTFLCDVFMLYTGFLQLLHH